MPIYMKIDKMTGAVRTAGFEDQIDIQSLQWGVGRSVTSYSGTSRNPSSPTMSEITVSKVMDPASMPLLRNATYGEAIPEVVISFTRDLGGGEQEAYLVITLLSVLISGYSLSSGGDFPMESLSLNFLVVSFEQTWRDDAYAEGGSDEFSFDLGTMKPV